MSDSPIQQATLDELIQSTDSDFVKDIIDTFLDDTPKMVAEMRQSLVTKDKEALQRAAHSLKSNSASFGAMLLSAQAKELEMMGKLGELNGVDDRITALSAEFERVKIVLREWQRGA